jgi:nicotinamide mononucleotide (NMN) deamidase PncC
VQVQPYLIRFAFGAMTSIAAGIVTLVLGPVAGGVFLGFPAILPATLTLLERDKGAVAAISDARGAVVGALGLIAFAAVLLTVAHRAPAAAAIAAALGAWVVSGGLLYCAGVGAARLLRLERYPPEIPVSATRPLIRRLRARHLTLFVVDAGAGGGLSAVLAEATDVDDVVRGSVVTADARSALRVVCGSDDDGRDRPQLALDLAQAARRWGSADIGLAIIGDPRAQPVKGESFHVAVATAQGQSGTRFEAHRGREGNWGEAVLLAVRFVCSTLDGEAEAVTGQPGQVSGLARNSLRASPEGGSGTGRDRRGISAEGVRRSSPTPLGTSRRAG